MTIVNGRTYRFINVYHNGYGLNIYGTGASDIKGGQNVCLYSESPTDSMQQWEVEERGSNGYRLHAVPKPSYVLDCSDGSISTSYKNTAHMCAGTGTTDADCAVEFEYVGGNQVRIHLGQKGLCLTATTVAESDAELSNNISTSAALRGGSEGRGNVYWKTPADEGSMTWKKQCWEVIEVGGGTDPKPEPKPGEEVTVTGMPDCWAYTGNEEYFHPSSGMVPGDFMTKNQGKEILNKIKNFYETVFQTTLTGEVDSLENMNKYGYSLFGSRTVTNDKFNGTYHLGVDMTRYHGAPVYSAHAGKLLYANSNRIAIYDSDKKVTYLYLHTDIDSSIRGRGSDFNDPINIKVGQPLGTQSDVGLGNGNYHLHFEVKDGENSAAEMPTNSLDDTVIGLYHIPYDYM